MKSFLLLTFLLTSFAGICQQPCIVTHVIDGDTYKFFYASKFKTVRLLNVDAPEIGQYFGTNAKDSVTKLLLGRTVNASIYKKDLYGRQLVSIQLKGINFDSLYLPEDGPLSITNTPTTKCLQQLKLPLSFNVRVYGNA